MISFFPLDAFAFASASADDDEDCDKAGCIYWCLHWKLITVTRTTWRAV